MMQYGKAARNAYVTVLSRSTTKMIRSQASGGCDDVDEEEEEEEMNMDEDRAFA